MSDTLARIIWLQKGVLSLVGITFAMVLALRGIVTGDAALTFMKWVLSCWLIAQGAEDVASHLSGTRKMMLQQKKDDPKTGA